MKRIKHRALVLLFMVMAAGITLPGETIWAGSMPWVILSEQSSLNLETGNKIKTTGMLIGDWEEKTNPEGTRTIPSFWGGDGNEPVLLSLRQESGGQGVIIPSGGFGMNIDTDLQLVSMDGLVIELQKGSTVGLEGTLYMEYETFRTYAPDSLYLGGFEIPIPIGSGELTEFSMVMDGDAMGVLLETEDPNTWTFGLLAIVQVSSAGNIAGFPFELPSVPMPLLLSGTYSETAGGASLVITFDELLDEELPLEPPLALPSFPFQLPTILPPGGFASVNMSLAMDEVGLVLGAIASIVSEPYVQQVPGDANGDGHVNVEDLLIIIGEWGPCVGCPGDFDGNDWVGVNELLIILQYWGI